MWKESTNKKRVFMASDRRVFKQKRETEDCFSVAVVSVSLALLLVLLVCCIAPVQSFLKIPCHECSLVGGAQTLLVNCGTLPPSMKFCWECLFWLIHTEMPIPSENLFYSAVVGTAAPGELIYCKQSQQLLPSNFLLKKKKKGNLTFSTPSAACRKVRIHK